jgi:hypothetical protein
MGRASEWTSKQQLCLPHLLKLAYKKGRGGEYVFNEGEYVNIDDGFVENGDGGTCRRSL